MDRYVVEAKEDRGGQEGHRRPSQQQHTPDTGKGRAQSNSHSATATGNNKPAYNPPRGLPGPPDVPPGARGRWTEATYDSSDLRAPHIAGSFAAIHCLTSFSSSCGMKERG